MVSFLTLWGTLRQTYSRAETLREYTHIYKSLDLGSVDEMYNMQALLRQKQERIAVIVTQLKTGLYVKAA